MRPGQTDHRSEGERLVRGILMSEEGLGNRRVPHAWAEESVCGWSPQWSPQCSLLGWPQGVPAGGKRKSVRECGARGQQELNHRDLVCPVK